jgi:hypothetical protein
VDEVNRLHWSLIRLDDARSIVDIEEAKNGDRRVNTIPPNAVEWLNSCRAEGPGAPPNYTKRMQRLRKRANVNYPQNAARHCFASYHIAFHQDAAQTAFLLGHPNAALLYKTYRTLVSFEEAERFWGIVPDSVLCQRAELEREKRRLREMELQQKARDGEKSGAKSNSCCGRAFKNVSGRWLPIDPIFPEEFAQDFEPASLPDRVRENM